MTRRKVHRHQARPGSQHGEAGAMAGHACTTERAGRPCPTHGAHVYVRCECGALGTICPQCRRIAWEQVE